MGSDSGVIVFVGVVVVGALTFLGSQFTKINNDNNTKIGQLYSELASLAPSETDNCTAPSKEVKCVTYGNVIVYQQTGKISVYDAVSKANIATFIHKDKTIHYSATSNTLNMLTLEFVNKDTQK